MQLSHVLVRDVLRYYPITNSAVIARRFRVGRKRSREIWLCLGRICGMRNTIDTVPDDLKAFAKLAFIDRLPNKRNKDADPTLEFLNDARKELGSAYGSDADGYPWYFVLLRLTFKYAPENSTVILKEAIAALNRAEQANEHGGQNEEDRHRQTAGILETPTSFADRRGRICRQRRRLIHQFHANSCGCSPGVAASLFGADEKHERAGRQTNSRPLARIRRPEATHHLQDSGADSAFLVVFFASLRHCGRRISCERSLDVILNTYAYEFSRYAWASKCRTSGSTS